MSELATQTSQQLTIGKTSATLLAPTSGEPKGAALIVLHDFYGLDEHTRKSAERLAALGYGVLVPDLFGDKTPAEDADEITRLDFAGTLSDAEIVSQIVKCVDFLTQDPSTPVGIIGWGWGGTYALLAAAHDSRIKVAGNIGGIISYPVYTKTRPGSPLNFVAQIQGALFAGFPGADPQISHNEIERLRGRIIEHDKQGEVKTYPDAPPRFWRDEDLPQTHALWRRLYSFIGDYIFQSEEETPFLSPQGIPDSGYPNEASRLHA